MTVLPSGPKQELPQRTTAKMQSADGGEVDGGAPWDDQFAAVTSSTGH